MKVSSKEMPVQQLGVVRAWDRDDRALTESATLRSSDLLCIKKTLTRVAENKSENGHSDVSFFMHALTGRECM